MPFPPATQKTDATNALASDTEHPSRHNAVAAAVNDLRDELLIRPRTVRKRMAADVSTSLATLQELPDLDQVIRAGVEYEFDFYARYDAAATTTGIGYEIRVWSDALKLTSLDPEWIIYVATAQSSAATSAFIRGHTANGGEFLMLNSSTTHNGLHVRGAIKGAVTGDSLLSLRFRSEVAGSAVTIKAGAISSLRT